MMQTSLFEGKTLSDVQTTEEKAIFLSRLVLNLRSRAVRRDVADCHQLHRTVMNSFPQLETGEQARQKFGILHRVETDWRNGKIVLLVQSFAEPDWANLPSEYLSAEEEQNPACKRVEKSFAAIETETELMFRLRANPTKRVGKNDTIAAAKFKEDKNRRRVEIHGEEKQIEWLQRKGELAGFRLTSVSLNSNVANASAQPNGKIYGTRLIPKDDVSTAAKRETLTFGAVVFEGELVVTDVEKFKDALTNGIGQGKAYGFGLLSIARPLSF